jgi:hypothetical protein
VIAIGNGRAIEWRIAFNQSIIVISGNEKNTCSSGLQDFDRPPQGFGAFVEPIFTRLRPLKRVADKIEVLAPNGA